jgi:hypothetical protein
MIRKLIDDDVETVTQWVTQGCYEELYSYIECLTGYDQLSDDELVTQFEERLGG